MTDVIVIGARGIPDVEGGAEKHAESVFPILAEMGYRIEVVGMRRFLKYRSFRKVHLKPLPTLNFGNTDKLVYHFLAFLYAVAKRPRLVHLQGLNSGLFLALYKAFGLKVVLRYGSSDHEHAKWGLLGRTAFRLCERQLRFADRVIAVSQRYRNELTARYGLTCVQVVPNGIDTAATTEEADAYWRTLGLDEKGYVLAVGRLTIDKDYDTLIEAFYQLGRPDLKLVIAGGQSESGYADRLLARQSDRVRFLGRVDRRLLPPLFSRCAAYVNSSHYEGLSNAILEAISHGCPVVVSDIPANAEMNLPGACYFRVGNAASLRERLDLALAEPDTCIPGRDRFPDWNAVAAQTAAIYEQIRPEFVRLAASSRERDEPARMAASGSSVHAALGAARQQSMSAPLGGAD